MNDNKHTNIQTNNIKPKNINIIDFDKLLCVHRFHNNNNKSVLKKTNLKNKDIDYLSTKNIKTNIFSV